MKTLRMGVFTFGLMVALATASSADTIRVGVIAPFSGPFATWGKQFKEAIEVYQAEHGTRVGDHVWRVAAFRTQRRRLSDTAARRTKPHTPSYTVKFASEPDSKVFQT